MALVLMALFLYLSYLVGFIFFGVVMSLIILSLLAPFIDTPSMKKSGKLTYYSPLFLAEKPKNGSITIHGGTLFDYVFVIPKAISGHDRTQFILQQYLAGLLSLIETYEETEPDIKLKGTSYIMSPRTAAKLGFTSMPTDGIQSLILIYNYFNLTLSNSLAKKRLSFPNLRKINTYEANLQDLIANKAKIKALSDKLKKRA